MVMLQIFAGLFALFALTRVVLRAKEKKLTWGEIIFWGAIWAVFIIILLVPEISTRLADWLGIGRGVDLMLYIAITVVFYMVFRLYVKFEQLEQEVTTAVREVALRDLEDRVKSEAKHGKKISER